MRLDKDKPRIVFLTTGYPTAYRPHECVFVHRSIKILSDSIQPKVIHFRALKPGRRLIENRVWEGVEITTLSIPQLPLGSYSYLNTWLMEVCGRPLVKSLLKSADLIHGAEAYPAGFVAGKWAKKYRKPFTFNVIGSDLNLFLKRNHSKLGNRWLMNLQGVICNSNALKNDLKSLIGELPNMQTIYRGVDTETFSPLGTKAGPQALLPPVRFLYLGGFHTWDSRDGTYNLKGEHTLLDAWRRIENKISSVSLAIGGPGVYQDKLQQWKTTLTKPQNVFCINSLNPSEVPDFIRSSDVVIIPSLNEGLPNIAKEALACGRPVLGTNVGGIPEVVQNGKTGLIIPPNDPESLAAGIKWFYDNRDQINFMGNNGRNQMIQLFSWEQYKINTLAFFGSAINKNCQGRECQGRE